MKQQLHEDRESLWWLASSPLIWGLHLLLSYGTAAIYCQKLACSFASARLAIGVYTGLSLAAICAIAVRSYRRHRYGDAEGLHDFDTPEDRHRFLGFATFLLSCLSAVAVIYQALPAVFIGSCR
jgi:hypothetical protein